jgi:hypothetical protein
LERTGGLFSLKLTPKHVQRGLLLSSAAILAGSLCLATAMVTASVLLPEEHWTDATSAMAGAAYALTILGSFVACLLSLAATIAASRSAAVPALLLLSAAVVLTC